jgi:hypothetical protein
MFVYYCRNVSHRSSVRRLPEPWVHMPFEYVIDHVVVLMLTLLLGRICSFVRPHSLKSHLTSLHNVDSSWCVYSLMELFFFGSAKHLSILASASRSLVYFLGGGVFLKFAIHFSTSSFYEACSSASVFSYDRRGQMLLNGDEVFFFCEN